MSTCVDSRKRATFSPASLWVVADSTPHSPTAYHPLIFLCSLASDRDIPRNNNRRWHRAECQRTKAPRHSSRGIRGADSEAFPCDNSLGCVGRFPDRDRRSIRTSPRRRRTRVPSIRAGCRDISLMYCAMFRTSGRRHWWAFSHLPACGGP